MHSVRVLFLNQSRCCIQWFIFMLLWIVVLLYMKSNTEYTHICDYESLCESP